MAERQEKIVFIRTEGRKYVKGRPTPLPIPVLRATVWEGDVEIPEETALLYPLFYIKGVKKDRRLFYELSKKEQDDVLRAWLENLHEQLDKVLNDEEISEAWSKYNGVFKDLPTREDTLEKELPVKSSRVSRGGSVRTVDKS